MNQLYNILYRCDNNNVFTIKFGDIGAISNNQRTLTFPPLENNNSEKAITWSLGITILMLVGGVYIDQIKYK